MEDDPKLCVEIDVAERWIAVPTLGLSESFPLDEFTVHRLIEGLDDIGITLQHACKIAAFEARRPAWMPQLS